MSYAKFPTGEHCIENHEALNTTIAALEARIKTLEDGGGGGGIPEAPNDGRPYTRTVTSSVGAWTYQPQEKDPFVKALTAGDTSVTLDETPTTIQRVVIVHDGQSGVLELQVGEWTVSGMTVNFVGYTAVDGDKCRVQYTA